jgi:hypothetical protein
MASPDRQEVEPMKRMLLIPLVLASVAGLAACDQAQKATDTLDKALSLKKDIEKKAVDIQKKAQELIPGNSIRNPGGQKDKPGEKEEDEEGEEEDD